MRKLELTVRLYFHNEFENTLTMYIEIPEDTSEEDEMKVMMAELRNEMEDMYGDYEEWKDGNIDWVLYNWNII